MKRIFAALSLTVIFAICSYARSLNEMELSEIRSLFQEHMDNIEMEGIVLEGSRSEARVATLSNDGSLIAVGFGKRISPSPNQPNFTDSQVKIYSAENFEKVAELTTPENGIPYSMAFSSDKTRLLVGYEEGAILWDLESALPVSVFLPKNPTGFDNPPPMRIDACGFSSDEEHALLAGGSVVSIYEVKSKEELTYFRTPWIKTASYLPSGDIITGHAGVANDVRVYDSKTGDLKRSFKCRSEIKSVIYESSGGVAYIAAFNPENHAVVDIYKWDLESDAPSREPLSLVGHKDNVSAVQFMLSIGSILTSSYDRTTKRWSAETGELQSTFELKNALATQHSLAIIENFNPVVLKMEQSNKSGDDNSE
ncbi:MAG: hypothetical protein AAF065_09065 [Verrucomicrobiota bacterium]